MNFKLKLLLFHFCPLRFCRVTHLYCVPYTLKRFCKSIPYTYTLEAHKFSGPPGSCFVSASRLVTFIHAWLIRNHNMTLVTLSAINQCKQLHNIHFLIFLLVFTFTFNKNRCIRTVPRVFPKIKTSLRLVLVKLFF